MEQLAPFDYDCALHPVGCDSQGRGSLGKTEHLNQIRRGEGGEGSRKSMTTIERFVDDL
jgi:hypothetical protein